MADKNLNEVYDAIRVAEKEGRTEDVAALVKYLDTLQTPQPTYDPREEGSMLYGAAAGASAGVVGPPLIKSGIDAVKAGRLAPPPSMAVPHPQEMLAPTTSAVDQAATKGLANEVSQQVRTSQRALRTDEATKVMEALKAKGLPVNPNILAEMPTQVARPGSGILLPLERAREIEIAERAPKPLPKDATFGQKAIAKMLPYGGKDIANFAKGIYDYKLPFIGGVGSLLGRGLAGAGAGMQGMDAYNRGVVQGDIPGAIISGIGGLGTAATLLPYAPAKLIGGGVGLSAEAINAYRDAIREGRIVEGAPEDYSRTDAMGNMYATGGLVYLAGGQPPKSDANEGGAFIGYPQINKNRKIGSGTGFLDALVGAPPSRTNILNPIDYSYMEGYEKGEPYGIIASMALPFVGAAAKPLAKEVATRAFMGESLTPKMMRGLMAEQPTAGIIKEPGGQWLNSPVEYLTGKLKFNDVLAPMSNRPSAQEIAKMEPHMQEVWNNIARDELHNTSLNKWVDSNLSRYIKNQLGSESDPIRKLADTGISHIPLDRNYINAVEPWTAQGQSLAAKRQKAGMSPATISQTDLGKQWENMADLAINPSSAQELLAKGKGSKYPWLKNIEDANTPVHDFSWSNLDPFGFDHVIDVLKQDLRSNALRPEQLNKISVADAVARTHAFNEQQAKAMAKAKLQMQTELPVHKEYPEGYKWMELKHPTNNEMTEQALKYEGDTMGHCVGGYCPEVLSGNTKIYSLRDAKGEPHVTVEVKKQDHPMGWSVGHGETFPKSFDWYDAKQNPMELPKDKYDAIYNRAQELFSQYPVAGKHQGNTNWNNARYDSFQQAADEVMGARPAIIQQIKGKQNLAPKEDYLPFVQDFVRSGNWADVKDLHNTGLLDTKNLKGKDYFSPAKGAHEAGELPRFVTQEELDKFN